MNTDGHLEEGDLILYAMRSLSSAEMAYIAALLPSDASMRAELAEIEFTLGAYAEATVPMENVPTRSASRLMQSIKDKSSLLWIPSPVPHPWRQLHTPEDRRVLPWLGWALAAVLLIATALQHHKAHALQEAADAQESKLKQESQRADALFRERDAMRTEITEQKRQAEAARLQAATSKDRSATLTAKVLTESDRARNEEARASELAEVARVSAQERDQLKIALTAQQSHVAQLNAQADSAKQITDALSDRTALRVTLTVPKQKRLPSGHGTYVASSGTLLFAASNMAPLHANKIYELWLLPTDGTNSVPAGTFLPDSAGNAVVLSSHFQKGIAAKGFAVTIEPAAGSQTPTLPLVLSGTT